MFMRMLGSIGLLAGTCIGAGMLALPLVTASVGFPMALGLFAIVALMMGSSALILAEVNLALSRHDLVTLSQKTLNIYGRLTTWSAYLFLLYLLNTAYIIGGIPWMQALGAALGLSISSGLAAVFFALLLMLIITASLRFIAAVNQLLILCLLLAFVALLSLGGAHISASLLLTPPQNITSALQIIPILITTFGFHIIIPTVVELLGREPRKIRFAIAMGTLIPLCVYILWIFLTLGTIPAQTLIATQDAKSVIAAFSNQLPSSQLFHYIANFFSLAALATSFIGVSTSLLHFLQDAFKAQNISKIFLVALTLIPSLLLAIYFPSSFTQALSFAGIFVAVLLGIIPIIMAYVARYRIRRTKTYLFFRHPVFLWMLGTTFLGVIAIELYAKLQ